MDRTREYHIKYSKSEKDKYFILFHMQNLKKKIIKQMDLQKKQKQIHRHRKQTYGYQRGKEVGRDKLGRWG